MPFVIAGARYVSVIANDAVQRGGVTVLANDAVVQRKAVTALAARVTKLSRHVTGRASYFPELGFLGWTCLGRARSSLPIQCQGKFNVRVSGVSVVLPEVPLTVTVHVPATVGNPTPMLMLGIMA